MILYEYDGYEYEDEYEVMSRGMNTIGWILVSEISRSLCFLLLLLLSSKRRRGKEKKRRYPSLKLQGRKDTIRS